jgi:uncharacterized protein (TIGR02145 family)
VFEGQYGVYDNDPINADIYGNLYNWTVVDDSREVCPAGWHVPSDDEFKTLEMFLGMSAEVANSESYRGTNEGSKLAGNAELWNDGELDNNAEFGTSGFNGLPAGVRNPNGNDLYMGNDLWFWSSTKSSNGYAWVRNLGYVHSGVLRQTHQTPHGFYVRCLETIEGCTDSYSPDYNPEANWNDGSCTYPDNGDYSLSFDGVDDWVEIPYNSTMDIIGNNPFTFFAKVNLKSNLFPYALFHTGTDGDPENSIRLNISTSIVELCWEYLIGLNFRGHHQYQCGIMRKGTNLILNLLLQKM